MSKGRGCILINDNLLALLPSSFVVTLARNFLQFKDDRLFYDRCGIIVIKINRGEIMQISSDVIQLIIFLIPGFFCMRIVEFKTDMIRKDYQFYVLEAVIYAMIIYAITNFVYQSQEILQKESLLIPLLIAIPLGSISGESKNKGWMPFIFFHNRKVAPSSHDRIYSLDAAEKMSNGWQRIGFKDGKEFIGLIRNFNSINNEMLIENAHLVIGEEHKELSPTIPLLYFPANQDLEYISLIANGEEN